MRLFSIPVLLAIPLLVGCYDASAPAPAVPAAVVRNSSPSQASDVTGVTAADEAQVKLQMLDWVEFQRLLEHFVRTVQKGISQPCGAQ
jgi:hypothetical protein